MGQNRILMVESPEEKELNKKKAILEDLKRVLFDHEIELATINAELRAFETEYFSRVGKYIIQQEELIQGIKNILDNQKLKEKFSNKQNGESVSSDNNENQQNNFFREESEESFQNVDNEEEVGSFKSVASEDLKELFREIAKKVHPDLAEDEDDRKRREDLMKEANIAFTRGDIERLKLIYNEMLPSIEETPEQSIGNQLIIIIRMIDNIENRIQVITEEINLLKFQDLYQLMETVKHAYDKGIDLLSRMKLKIVKDIQEINDRLTDIILDFSSGDLKVEKR